MNDTVKYSNLFNVKEKLPRVMAIKSMITYAVPYTLPELIEKMKKISTKSNQIRIQTHPRFFKHCDVEQQHYLLR